MTIPRNDWYAFIKKLRTVSDAAVEDLGAWMQARGGYNLDLLDMGELLGYVWALVNKYGSASSALAATWYDELAALSGKLVPAAEVVAPVEYAEVAKTVNGVIKQSANEDVLAGAVERLVKMQGVDTTLRNAIRDGAEVAWIPNGDTCAFCIALASRGWQRAGKKSLKNGHAEHVHAHCDCTYAVRFDGALEVPGYDPGRYESMYYGADGSTPTARINAMRREFYAENKDKINAQKRLAYKERQALKNASAAEEAKP